MESSKSGRQVQRGGSIETTEEGTRNTKDMITELPDEMLHKILTFLEAKDVARTSTLSKRLQSVWLSFPNIDLDETYWSAREEFINYVRNSLQQRSQVNIQTFKLCMKNLNNGMSSRIHSWIKSATKGNLKELDINMSANILVLPIYHVLDERCRCCYRLPQSIFTTQSLTVLKLRRCKLVPSGIKLPCLKTLSLEEIHAKEGIIQNLLSTCLVVETLILKSCSGLMDFYCSGSQLQTLVVSKCAPYLNNFNIETPNLQSFSLDLHADNPSINLFQIKAASLKSLSLQFLTIEEDIFHGLISKLDLLENLKVVCCGFLRKLEVYAHKKLKTLEVFKCRNLVELEIDAPRLQSFSLDLDADNPLINLFQIKAASLKSLSLQFLKIEEDIFHGLISNLPHLENLKVVCCGFLRKLEVYAHKKLKTLEVFKCKNLVELEIDAPQLISFIYTGQMLQIYLMNTSGKINVELHLKPIAGDSNWFSKLRKLLGMFGHAKILAIHCKAHKTERFIIPKELRESSVPPLLDLKHMKLLTTSESIMNYEELIDSLLWISPNIETLSIETVSSCKTLTVQDLQGAREE